MADSGLGASAATPPLDEQVGAASSILFLVSSFEEYEREGCLDLLTVDEPAALEAMYVTFVNSFEEWCDRWCESAVATLPAKIWMVSSDEYARSAATESDSGSTITTPCDSLRIDTVSSPANLTELGVTITEQLKAYQESQTDRQLVVCMHSSDILLQYTDVQQVFKFLNVLTGHLQTADAIAHYHLNPDAHDEQTINTLRPLFDAVVSYGEPDGWTIQTRSE